MFKNVFTKGFFFSFVHRSLRVICVSKHKTLHWAVEQRWSSRITIMSAKQLCGAIVPVCGWFDFETIATADKAIKMLASDVVFVFACCTLETVCYQMKTIVKEIIIAMKHIVSFVCLYKKQ